MGTAATWMRQHKALTGVGAFVVLGTIGSLTDSSTSAPENPSSTPQGFVSVPSASSTPGQRQGVPNAEVTAPTEPTVPSARPSATAAPATTKALVVSSPTVATAAPKPAVTTAPRPVATKPAPAAREYANCSELNADHPHGVGQPGARDKTSTGNPVTTFTVDQALYDANTKSDRDDDGVACEKH